MSRLHEVGTSVHRGFPNAADDTRLSSLSLDALLAPQPHSAYFFHIIGTSWEEQGIFDGDIAVIDRSLQPRPHDRTIWWQGDEFAIGYASGAPPGAQTWGRITAIVHRF